MEETSRAYAITYQEEVAGEEHRHIYGVSGFSWKDGMCTAQLNCSGCGEPKTEFVTFAAKDGNVTMNYVPTGLMLMIAGYTGNQMTDVQVVDAPQTANNITVTGDSIKVFFANGVSVPLRAPLIVK